MTLETYSSSGNACSCPPKIAPRLKFGLDNASSLAVPHYSWHQVTTDAPFPRQSFPNGHRLHPLVCRHLPKVPERRSDRLRYLGAPARGGDVGRRNQVALSLPETARTGLDSATLVELWQPYRFAFGLNFRLTPAPPRPPKHTESSQEWAGFAGKVPRFFLDRVP